MRGTETITAELRSYHILSLKRFSLLSIIGSLVFAWCSVQFLNVSSDLLMIFVPFGILAFINTSFITRIHKGGRIGYFIMSLLSWLTVTVTSYFTGGVYSPFIFIYALLLSSAFLFARKLGVIITGVVLISFGVLYYLTKQGLLNHNMVPEGSQEMFHIFSLVYLLYLICVLAVFYNKSAEKARNSRIVIREQNQLIQLKNKQMMENVHFAAKIQRSIFVAPSVIEENFKEYCLFFQPKDKVGGDFYWLNKISDGKFIWAVGDCTGHGVSGALMTMIGTSLMNDIVIENKIIDPKNILDALHEGFRRDLNQNVVKSGMNVGVALLDLNAKKVQFSGAKTPIHLIRNDRLEVISGTLKSVGDNFDKAETYVFKKVEFDLQENDILYMFTDGYADQLGGRNNQKFFLQNLHDLLVAINHYPMRDQELTLRNTFNKWNIKDDQIDDVLVMGLRI